MVLKQRVALPLQMRGEKKKQNDWRMTIFLSRFYIKFCDFVEKQSVCIIKDIAVASPVNQAIFQ